MTAESAGALQGILAASVTPLTSALEPDIPAFIDHSRWLLAEGCDGLGILGTTGEANSLSLGQRLTLIEAAMAQLPVDRLLVGTGSCALADVIALTRASLGGGAAHVLVLPPFYYKPMSDDALFRFFAALIEAVGDDRLRIYLYNFPQLTGVNFSVGLIGRLQAAFPRIIAGIKDSSGSWENLAGYCRSLSDFASFAGSEKLLLATLRAGGAGCISATANVTAALCHQLLQRWQGEDADGLQERLSAIREALQQFPLVAAMKALTRLRTGAAIWERMIPPMIPLNPSEAAALLESLARVGFEQPQSAPQAAAAAR